MEMRAFYHYFGSYAHPFYRDMARNPPPGFRAVVSDDSVLGKSGLRHVQGNGTGLRHALALRAARFLGYPKLVTVKKPAECRFIHAAQYLLRNTDPWVTDFEDATAFTWYDHNVIRKPWTKRLIRRTLEGDACKRILPWTEAARQSLLRTIPHGRWTEKTEVLYPCIDAGRFKVAKRNERKHVELLFVGGGFYEKGGVETIEAFKLLREKYDVGLTMVSKYDEATLARYGNEPGLRLMSKVPQEELDAIYDRADVFVMPTHYDTFGLVYLEAMARGLPCVGTTQFSVPEIVQEHKTGLLVRNHVSRFDETFAPIPGMNPYNGRLLERTKTPPPWAVQELAEKLGTLIESRTLRQRLGRNGRREVETGRFSVKTYRQTMKSIYRIATR